MTNCWTFSKYIMKCWFNIDFCVTTLLHIASYHIALKNCSFSFISRYRTIKLKLMIMPDNYICTNVYYITLKPWLIGPMSGKQHWKIMKLSNKFSAYDGIHLQCMGNMLVCICVNIHMHIYVFKMVPDCSFKEIYTYYQL